MSAIPSKNRDVVKKRHMNQCARCGCPGYEIHHRQRRREGGHGVENLVLLCRTCHSWVHDHPMQARIEGYIIPISESDVSTIQIKTFAGWMSFTKDGDIAW